MEPKLIPRVYRRIREFDLAQKGFLQCADNEDVGRMEARCERGTQKSQWLIVELVSVDQAPSLLEDCSELFRIGRTR